MAIIADEYGGASGIVTAKDIVTEVMGELEEDSNDLTSHPEVSTTSTASRR